MTTEENGNGTAVAEAAAEEVAATIVAVDVTGLNLFQRLVLVKQAIGKVGKTAKAPDVMGGFKYVPWEGIADRIGDLLAAYGIVALPDMPEYDVQQTADKVGSSNKTNYRTTVKLSLTLINADTPEDRHILSWYGVGDDTSDKGLQKAGTNGTKYLLMKAFMLGGLGGADDTDATGIDHDSVSTPIDYGPCPRPGCTGRVVRKSRKTGDDMAVCSTQRYDARTRQKTGCQWIDWEPDFDAYEERAKVHTAPPEKPAEKEKPARKRPGSGGAASAASSGEEDNVAKDASSAPTSAPPEPETPVNGAAAGPDETSPAPAPPPAPTPASAAGTPLAEEVLALLKQLPSGWPQLLAKKELPELGGTMTPAKVRALDNGRLNFLKTRARMLADDAKAGHNPFGEE